MSKFRLQSLFVILSFFVTTLCLWSENKHIVDFDTSFYKKTPYSRWMRDPFRNSPGFSKGAAGKTAWPKLSSISKKDGKLPYAILDGKKYKEGEFVNENRYISAIGQNFVIVTEGNFDYELVMTEAAMKAADAAATTAGSSSTPEASRNTASDTGAK